MGQVLPFFSFLGPERWSDGRNGKGYRSVALDLRFVIVVYKVMIGIS